MGMYFCARCGFTTEEEGEASLHAFEEHDLEVEDCFSEEAAIEESLDETPDETEVIDEEDLLNLARAKAALEDYDGLDETEQKMVLSRVLGLSRGSDKVFAEKATTSNAIPKAYTDLIDKLQDEKLTACPVCGRSWENLAKEETAILSDEKTKVGIPLVRIMHIKGKHVPIWNLIAELFGMPAEKIPDERVSTTPNPENVSATQNPEELSREELAQRISESPELRKQFYRKWIRKLQDRD